MSYNPKSQIIAMATQIEILQGNIFNLHMEFDRSMRKQIEKLGDKVNSLNKAIDALPDDSKN